MADRMSVELVIGGPIRRADVPGLCQAIRANLDGQGFLEVETPLLGKSTPEGARDYLVPSRLYHGEWYALPQSPQLYKEYGVAGFERVFETGHVYRAEPHATSRHLTEYYSTSRRASSTPCST